MPIDRHMEERRKRNIEALYASVKAQAPDLYTRVVAIASVTFPDSNDVHLAAKLEGLLMELISDALRRG